MGPGSIKEYIDLLEAMPEKDRQSTIAEAIEATKNDSWIPNPGPQTEAYFSLADVLLYGGEPGGGRPNFSRPRLQLPSTFTRHAAPIRRP